MCSRSDPISLVVEPGEYLTPPTGAAHEMLDRFTDGAGTTGIRRDEMRSLLNLRRGIGGRQSEPTGLEGGKIRQIITHERDLIRHQSMSCDDLLQGRILVGHVLVDLVDTELGHADAQSGRMSSGHDHDRTTLSNPGTNGEPIVNVKELSFDAMPVVADGAVGEDSITIESEQ